MSFSSEVKRELCKIRENSKKNRRLLLGGMLFCARFRQGEIHTSNAQVKALFVKLSAEFPTAKLSDSEVIQTSNDRENGLFLRGVFLVSGTVSDPDKNYHLEITPPVQSKLQPLFTLISESGIAIKKTTRNSRGLLYLKESESVADFLTYIGAGVNSMEIMNAKIFKELRNNVNRAVNCDSANMDKTARAASRQIADIELIYKEKGKGFLPRELSQVAELRLENYEMSLKEIGAACEPKISRSGVFHRLEKIRQMAKQLTMES
ncbi:MAG: DNA-binding protein WhiA [Oscillospiraceae bacterium]|nr:DNA-binding protein WhiA [Oscillospiraceae bacterium]